jgi:hypothetical protein
LLHKNDERFHPIVFAEDPDATLAGFFLQVTLVIDWIISRWQQRTASPIKSQFISLFILFS